MEKRITRRSFVAGSVAAGLAAAATGVLASCSPGGNSQAGADSSSATNIPTNKPGFYSAKSIGIDEMTVTMEIVDGTIKSVEIDANESPELGQPLIETLARSIKSAQSENIDVITGATITSCAVREAARSCILQSKGEPAPVEDDCISPIEPAGMPENWDYEADVVIVGASLAGVVSAAKLAQGGKDILVLEKERIVGGSGRITSCIGNYGGTFLYEGDEGYFGTPYHDQDVIDFFQERARWSVNSDLLKNITISLRETLDWMNENGGMLGSIGRWWCTWMPTPDYNHSADAPSSGLMAKWAAELAESNGAQFLFNSPATRIVKDGDQIVGVEARDPSGATIYAKCREAVILSADNMQRNPKMLEKYCGLGAGVRSGVAKGTGQVIRMGQGVGADMAGIGSFAASAGMPIPDEIRAMLPMRRYYDGMNYVCSNPWCRFDAQGNRVSYVSDDRVKKFSRSDDSLDRAHRLCCQELSHGGSYIVFDADWLTNLDNNGASGGVAVWKYITDQNGWDDPDRGVYDFYGSPDIAENMEDLVASSAIKRADSLEELEEAMDLDAGVLVTAVSTWNDDCAAGEGDALHGYTAQNMIPVATPPFYGAYITPGLYASFAGLKVSSKNEVIDTEGNVIPGLYAAFHTAGGIAGESQQLCPVGDQIGSMLASGYNIAKALLGEEWVMI